MKTETQKDEMMRRYLLDEMSDNERQSIEENFLEDDDFFEEIAAFEDELFYEYKQNRLTKNQRFVFEEKFLKSPQDQEKAAFAEAFLQATEEIGKEKSATNFWQSIAAFFNFSNSALRVGMALATVLVVFGFGIWLITNSRWQDVAVEIPKNINTAMFTPTPPEIDEKIIEEKQKEQDELDKRLDEEKQKSKQNADKIREIEVKREKLQREIEENRKKNVAPSPKMKSEPRTVVAVALLPGLFTRSDGEGGNKIKLSSNIKTLQLNLSLKNQEEYKNYRVVVSNIDEGEVWTGATSKVRGKGAKRTLSLNIPSEILKRADYELSLFGITANGETEEITTYYFTVLK